MRIVFFASLAAVLCFGTVQVSASQVFDLTPGTTYAITGEVAFANAGGLIPASVTFSGIPGTYNFDPPPPPLNLP
jgi:hypothetical protein